MSSPSAPVFCGHTEQAQSKKILRLTSQKPPEPFGEFKPTPPIRSIFLSGSAHPLHLLHPRGSLLPAPLEKWSVSPPGKVPLSQKPQHELVTTFATGGIGTGPSLPPAHPAAENAQQELKSQRRWRAGDGLGTARRFPHARGAQRLLCQR